MLWIAILAALVAGATNPFQAGANAELNKQLSQPLFAGLWVYLSGFLTLLAAALALRRFSASHFGRLEAALPHVHWWAYLGGIISIAATLAGLLFAQRLGSGMFTALSVSVSLIVSVLLDQFGLVGFRQHTASPARLAGCALLIGGVWLISRF